MAKSDALSHLLWRKIQLVERICRTHFNTPLTVSNLLELRHKCDHLTAKWVHQQLIGRMASQLQGFHLLPYSIGSNPYLLSGYNSYYEKLQQLTDFVSVENNTINPQFIKHLYKLRYESDEKTMETMGKAAKQILLFFPEINLNRFFKGFFFSRITQRLLLDHFLPSAASDIDPSFVRLKNDLPGCIEKFTTLKSLIQDCIDQTKSTCCGSYGFCPEVILTERFQGDFSYSLDHIRLIVIEALKNACRATVEFSMLKESIIFDGSDLPPIHISIDATSTHLTIRLFDQGGGVPLEDVPKLFIFGFTSINKSHAMTQEASLNRFIRSDLAGYGFGLPLAQVFSQYFGGNTIVESSHGVGFNVLVTLPNLENNPSQTLSSQQSSPTTPIYGDTLSKPFKYS